MLRADGGALIQEVTESVSEVKKNSGNECEPRCEHDRPRVYISFSNHDRRGFPC